MQKTEANEHVLLIEPQTSLFPAEFGRSRALPRLGGALGAPPLTLWPRTSRPFWGLCGFFCSPCSPPLFFTLLFARMGKLPHRRRLPPLLFYLSWHHFLELLFRMPQNQQKHLYRKPVGVWQGVFSRLVLPVSVTLSNLIRLGVQFVLFAVIYLYFVVQGYPVKITR